jgi:hypothetical protein
MTKPIEILIHISAPSRVQDDRIYRQQARGFLDFKPLKRYGLNPRSEVTSTRTPEQVTAIPSYSTKSTDDQEFTGLPRSQDAGGRDSILEDFTNPPSPIGGLSTIRKAVFGSEVTPARREQPYGANTSNDGGNKRVTRVDVERTPAIVRPRTAPALKSPIDFRGHKRRHSDSWRTPPSIVPDSQPSRNILKHDALPSDPPDSSQQSASRPPKRPRVLSPTQQSSSTHGEVVYPILPQISSFSDQLHTSFITAEEISSQRSDATDHLQSIQIHPAPPPTDVAPFNTHITPSLALIASKLPLDKHFRPVMSTRPLKDLERGHWKLKVNKSWSLELRGKFWAFLEQLVGEGKVGWGVWCEKVTKRTSNKNEENMPKENVAAGSPLETIGGGSSNGGSAREDLKDEQVRVWCWGEAAPYIYLVLFIASNRAIKGMGSEWVDAGGNTVIKML